MKMKHPENNPFRDFPEEMLIIKRKFQGDFMKINIPRKTARSYLRFIILSAIAACLLIFPSLPQSLFPLPGYVYSQTFREGYSNYPKIEGAVLSGNFVKITWDTGNQAGIGMESAAILRSVSPIGSIPFDPVWYPITRYELYLPGVKGSFTDKYAADGTKYYYLLETRSRSGKVYRSNPITVTTTFRKLPGLRNPVIHIDKIHYLLEIEDGGKVVKRYACCLGRNPSDRKLHQDCATTPEGIYSIIDLQPNYAYHKAYDLSYPNEIDYLRYEFASAAKLLPKRDGVTPGIGGEVQIHGGAKMMNSNWSFGCIMIKNDDIDELFRDRAIAKGTRVIITGRELTREDLKSINMRRSRKEIEIIQKKLKKAGANPGAVDGVMGAATMKALGRFQKKFNIPITCQLDCRTMELLKKRVRE